MKGSGNKGKVKKGPGLPFPGDLKNSENISKNSDNISKNLENISKNLVTFWEPYSVASEQYRKLKTHILEVSKNDTKRVFLVSSAIRGEGKTLTATNLAISIASGLHETALLIDADLRKPDISHMLGLKNDIKGLAEYLTYGGNLADFITRTSIPKLSVIVSGLPPENPFELISSEYMSNLIKEVKYRYDNRYVIIDCPPLVSAADPIALSSLVDAVIIVVKVSATQREMVNDAINKIENKEKIFGLILNGW